MTMTVAAMILALLCAAPLPVRKLLTDAARSKASYAAPGRVRGAAEEALFRAVLAAATASSPGALAALRWPARALGFRLLLGRDTGDAGARVVLLVESAPRGAGAYLVRIGAARATFVQAPHSLSDEGTLGIALAVYRALDARALAVSSLHRRNCGRPGPAVAGGQMRSGIDREDAPAAHRCGADVAHDGSSTFQRMTLAFLTGVPGATVAQLHGFADARAPHDVILSAGDGSPAPAWLSAATRRLAGALPDARVVAFPDGVTVLGGTTNQQGRATRRHGARFVHIELSGSLRGELRGGPARRKFAAALSAALTDPA